MATRTVSRATIIPKTHIPTKPKPDRVLLRNWGAYFENKVKTAETQDWDTIDNDIAARVKFPLRRHYELDCKNMIDMKLSEGTALCYDYVKKFKNSDTKDFDNHLCLKATGFFRSTSSNGLRTFFTQNTWIPKYEESFRRKAMKAYDQRPLWKKLRNEKKCDVVSLLEEHVPNVLPVQKAKQAHTFKIFAQTYLQCASEDLVFLKKLKLDNHIKESLPTLNDYIAEQYAKTMSFVKLLHQRNPMYSLHEADHNNHIKQKMKQDHKYRLQYQSHRDALALLKVMRALSEARALKKMRDFIEEIMSKYMSIKTESVMPGRFELLTEMYNIFALMVADCYTVPKNISLIPSSNKINVLLQIPSTVYSVHHEFKFGDKSTMIDLTEDRGVATYKKKLLHFENRLKIARHSIERCYLYHEISHLHIVYRHNFEAVNAATKAVLEANSIRHTLWEFLGLLCIVKAHTALGKYAQERKALDMCLELAEKLKSERLKAFIRLCLYVSQTREFPQLDQRESSSSKRLQPSASRSLRSIGSTASFI